MKKKFIYTSIILLLIVLFLKNCGFQIGNVRIGRQDDFVGNNKFDFKKSNFYKNKISSDSLVILNTWATWCKPCIEEFPIFQELQKEKSHVEFYFLSVDKDSLKLSNFLNKNKYLNDITFENISYRNAILNSLNGKRPDEWIDSYTVPETYIIKKSKVVKKITGSVNYDELKSIIEDFEGF
ncbi:TlpA family protein disulfide reductase [Flavobacterium azooxidireducens]|uniref:TlpA family protein disulfide reductase n=1 Tax=Flavobacterium azooxidireducens TaxID=1871076 RepID=A0ABY4KHS9_9FLAO|nr:TlpA disulfide reductase family protein [Flavobacterium azooxidireducens]UPQ80373.1 TlpA family protein disulfide reductase [Flavobacterium azooxidireducens]